MLSVEEKKARRLAGMKRAKQEMTTVQKIHRALVNGRPPASELKSLGAALVAARVLYRELESRMTAEGLKPKAGDWAVSIGYVSPDLSLLGVTLLYTPGDEVKIATMLAGNVILGLVFGMIDKEAEDEEGRIVVGARPFFDVKQTEDWLDQLQIMLRVDME